MTERAEQDGADSGMIERWGARQEQLAALLDEWGAGDSERRVDWVAGRVEWVEPTGQPLVLAEMKALCSYALADESLMMAWANEGLEQGAVIEPLDDVPDLIESCTEAEAWMWAMNLAEQVGADFLYRMASDEYLVFLGLWNVRPAVPAAPAEPGSPQAFVVEMLVKLSNALPVQATDPLALRRLFLNHGESLHGNAKVLHADRSDAGLLHRTGDALIEIGNSLGQRRFGILPPAALSKTEVDDIQRRLARLRVSWLRETA